jgi:hypothetical protein
MAGCKVPHITGQDEREQQRQEENPKKSNRQRSHLGPSITKIGARHMLIHSSVLQQRDAAGSELTGSVCNACAFEGYWKFSRLREKLSIGSSQKAVENAACQDMKGI